jgi:hypothetical protein
MLATLVTILTLANGGPPAVAGSPRAEPEVLRDTTIKVFRDVGTEQRPYVELYEGGELTMRLPPGLYSIEANLDTPSPGHPVPCDVVSNEPTVSLRVGHRKIQRIKLSCSIK